jgi:GNAT superfamily N-acetyltransferase
VIVDRVRIVALTSETAAPWAELFAASASTCFCRYWHFEGRKSEWLARCFEHPEENRREQELLVRSGQPEGRGLLALDGSSCVGWMKLVPRACLPKLVQQGAYRPLDLGSDRGVWSISCFLVRPALRHRGIARALIAAAPNHVRAWAPADEAAEVLEAYPRGTAAGAASHLHDEEAWMGTQSLFESCGFERVAGEPVYPVMRKKL